MEYLWVALGSALGGASRHALSIFVAHHAGSAFPWGTLLVNVSGSLLIGLLGALVSPGDRLDPQFRPFATHFLMAGVCGGFTTFSSFSLQTLSLWQRGEWLAAGGNVLLSLGLCLLAVWLGFLGGRAMAR